MDSWQSSISIDLFFNLFSPLLLLQSYPLWGECGFLLSEVEEQEGVMSGFSLSIRQSTGDDGQVYRSVALKTYGYEIAMNPGVVWEILVWLRAGKISSHALSAKNDFFHF